MGTHIGTDVTYKSVTPDEWLPVAAAVREYAESLAHRPDLSVEIGPEAAEAAGTAHWQPRSATLALHTPALLPGVKAENVDFADKLWRLRNAAFCGAILHECGHATYSVHVPAELAALRETVVETSEDGTETEVQKPFYTPRELDVINILEESRVESRMINAGYVKSWERPFLVRMALEVVLGEFRVAETPYGASMGAALTLARVDAGSLDADSGERFRKMILDSGMLDAATLDTLRVLWRSYQSIPTTVWEVRAGARTWNHDQTRRIAREWIALVIDPETEDPMDDLAQPGAGEGSDATGGESGAEGEGKGEGGSFTDKLDDLAREESLGAEGEIKETMREEARERKVAEVKAEAEQRAEGRKAEDKVYEGTGAHGWDGTTTHSTRLRNVRAPQGDERAAAVRFQRELSKAAYADVERIATTSTMPPGRLRGRGAVMTAAQIATQQTVTAEPFKSVRRVHTDQTKLRVAVLSDISGSMSRSEEATAVLSYVLARGAAAADAKVASILFGDRSVGVVKPGQKVDRIVVAAADHSSEIVKPGLMAADSLLDLTTGSGARVVIILSDGHLVDPRQAEYMRNWLARAKRAGVVVVWANYGHVGSNHGYGKIVDLSGKTAAQAATTLGQVVVREVARVSTAIR